MFKTGVLITDEKFISRKNYVSSITSFLNKDKNIVIQSPKRYGKTSLIKNVFNQNKYKSIYINIKIAKDLKHLADFIISEDGNVNIGGIVKLRDDDNRVSISDYKILGFDKYNRVFTLKALNPNVTEKIVTRSLSEIFYKGVTDFPSRKLKMGEDISPDSFDLMLNDTEELKKARENFFDDQDTPEYFRRIAEENRKDSQLLSSPEISPDRDVPQGLSPNAAYGPTTPSPPYGSHSPDYDPYENKLNIPYPNPFDELEEYWLIIFITVTESIKP